MEEIKKSYTGSLHVADAKTDIDLINQYALKKMTPDEVFAFNVNLCDDQQDRDLEKFSVHALQQMAKLFPGKPMLSDHSWSALRQIGRIYKAEVVQHKGITYLRGSVYMVRSDSTNDIIKSIEAGVLKEVSVGCSCKKRTCSECGADVEYDFMKGGYICKNGHRKGDTGKNGKPILTVLDDVTDAYELSFVAVPAQPGAGTTKGKGTAKELSPEEERYRKEILLQNERVISKFQETVTKPEEKHYDDFIPTDDYGPDTSMFAFLPQDIIPEKIKKAAYEALGFCRKELGMQTIRIRWFAPVEDAENLGLDVSELSKFHYSASVGGLASRKNPNQILIRYPQKIENIQKTVFHETWHTFQFKDPVNPCLEENAYWYQDDALQRFLKLSEEERNSLYWYSHS